MRRFAGDFRDHLPRQPVGGEPVGVVPLLAPDVSGRLEGVHEDSRASRGKARGEAGMVGMAVSDEHLGDVLEAEPVARKVFR